jgi:predicted amidohydrolase
VRITLLQLRIDDSESLSDRVERVAELVRQQRGAELVVLPELWIPGAFAYTKFAPSAAPLSGTALRQISSAAKEIGAFVLAGTVIESDGEQHHNTAVLIGPSGDVVYSYRKVHLFGFDRGEAAMLTAGSDVSAFRSQELPPLAMTTCYDLRFPELYRLLVDDGAELIVVPAGWPAARIDHWLLLLRARAVENQLFVIGCNQVGQQEGTELGGHSIVIDPWGRVLAEAGTDEAIVTVELDMALVAKTRAEFPVLADRRLGLPTPARPAAADHN